VIADSLWASEGYILADWNNRDQPLAVHADDLSKILTPAEWTHASRPTAPAWVFDLIIQEVESGKAVSTTIRIPRIAECLPSQLRHRQPGQLHTL
jgi:phage terminase large subunit-like protein